jgi:hypothetical protein
MLDAGNCAKGIPSGDAGCRIPDSGGRRTENCLTVRNEETMENYLFLLPEDKKKNYRFFNSSKSEMNYFNFNLLNKKLCLT